jgi:hypothetical protein
MCLWAIYICTYSHHRSAYSAARNTWGPILGINKSLTEAAQFPQKEYINGIFVDMHVLPSPCVYRASALLFFYVFPSQRVTVPTCYNGHVLLCLTGLPCKCVSVTMPPCYHAHLQSGHVLYIPFPLHLYSRDP